MNVTIFGVGYVGLVQGAVLASVGHQVVCVDIDKKRVADLNAGHIPIFEPGLEPLVKDNIETNRLRFTTDKAIAKLMLKNVLTQRLPWFSWLVRLLTTANTHTRHVRESGEKT